MCGFGETLGLFFQRWLVAMGIEAENLAMDLAFLQRLSGTIVPFMALQVANQDSLITDVVLENHGERFLQWGWAVGRMLLDQVRFVLWMPGVSSLLLLP